MRANYNNITRKQLIRIVISRNTTIKRERKIIAGKNRQLKFFRRWVRRVLYVLKDNNKTIEQHMNDLLKQPFTRCKKKN